MNLPNYASMLVKYLEKFKENDSFSSLIFPSISLIYGSDILFRMLI